jgi:hypothetical protein
MPNVSLQTNATSSQVTNNGATPADTSATLANSSTNLALNNLVMPTNNNWQSILNVIQQLLNQLIANFNKPKELQLSDAQTKNAKSLFNTNLNVKVQDSNKNGQLNVGDTLVFSDTNNRTYEVKISSEDMLKAIRGDYGKALNIDLQALGNNLKAQGLLTQDTLGVVFDKNKDGKLSAGDIAVTYASKPQIALPPPGVLIPIWYLTDKPQQFIQLTSEHLKEL